MSAAERSRDAAEPNREAYPSQGVPPRRQDPDVLEAGRLAAAVDALERVRTQLARTQRTLDAFVTQIAGTPDDSRTRAALAAAPAPLTDPASAVPRVPVPADPSRFEPPSVLADHVLPPAELQPPPAPVVARAPMAPTAPAAPAEAPAPRPAPPNVLSGHVHAPGQRPASAVPDVVAAPATDGASAGPAQDASSVPEGPAGVTDPAALAAGPPADDPVGVPGAAEPRDAADAPGAR